MLSGACRSCSVSGWGGTWRKNSCLGILDHPEIDNTSVPEGLPVGGQPDRRADPAQPERVGSKVASLEFASGELLLNLRDLQDQRRRSGGATKLASETFGRARDAGISGRCQRWSEGHHEDSSI